MKLHELQERIRQANARDKEVIGTHLSSTYAALLRCKASNLVGTRHIWGHINSELEVSLTITRFDRVHASMLPSITWRFPDDPDLPDEVRNKEVDSLKLRRIYQLRYVRPVQ